MSPLGEIPRYLDYNNTIHVYLMMECRDEMGSSMTVKTPQLKTATRIEILIITGLFLSVFITAYAGATPPPPKRGPTICLRTH